MSSQRWVIELSTIADFANHKTEQKNEVYKETENNSEQFILKVAKS